MGDAFFIAWEMNDIKRIKPAEHVQMAQASHRLRMECDATHIYCHASQVDLFDGLGYTVKPIAAGSGVISPGVFWIGVA